MRMRPFIQYPLGLFSPEFMEVIHYPEDRLGIPFIRAKIPSLCILAAILPEMLDQNHVPMQWIQNVLPRSDRIRISHLHWLPARKALIVSGTRRPCAQSPPPTTFPARAVATAGTTELSPKKNAW